MSAPWLDTLGAQARVAGYLDRLALAPPKTLLLEGGTRNERLDLALYWAARINCLSPDPPCGVCRACVQIISDVCRDLILLNGAQGAISIETVREIRAILADPPAGKGQRVILLAEAQALGDAAANALLKSLEEPWPGNLFVLLAPNRDTLLPTLVSRSFVLTLSWPQGADPDPALEGIVADLAQFIQTGRGGWLEWTAKKGNVDADLARRLLLEVQRALLMASYGNPLSSLALLMAQRLDVVAVRQVGVIVENALESLGASANPALVLEWTAIRIWGLMHK